MISDKFLAKNAASARAWEETKKKDNRPREKKASEPKIGICEKCKKEAALHSYISREMAIEGGAASFGRIVHFYCEDCMPQKRRNTPTEPPMTAKQVKNLLRGAKKNLR